MTNIEFVCATTANVFHIVRNESHNSMAKIVTRIGTPTAHFDCPGRRIGAVSSVGELLIYDHQFVGIIRSQNEQTLEAIWKALARRC